jgi:EAL domain-containing protein (putative c-di-GMP-specific phosphodiesterase class I)
MLSLDAEQQLERLGARLGSSGALGLLLIEARPLEGIERRYGLEAHRTVLEGLKGLVRDLASQTVPAEDVAVLDLPGEDAIFAFVFRPRSDAEFYAEGLRQLSARVSTEITRQGKSLVYPYFRDPLFLPVGLSVVLHNPDIKPEREIRTALEAARHDARLESQLQARHRADTLLGVILKGDLNVRFEPLIDLRRSEVFAYEALVRGPQGSALRTPKQLFRQAAEAGLVYELDCLCRRVALENSGVIPRGKKLFLNVLPTSISDPNLSADGLRKILEEYPLRPTDLVLEISERESIENFATFREMRDSCRELGIQVAVDDAGAGHASLEAVMEIAPDYLKADMGLVRGIDTDPPRQEVMKSLNAVARRIGARAVAEGIETEGELRIVRELGIRYGQGFLFGEALTPDSPPDSRAELDVLRRPSGETQSSSS